MGVPGQGGGISCYNRILFAWFNFYATQIVVGHHFRVFLTQELQLETQKNFYTPNVLLNNEKTQNLKIMDFKSLFYILQSTV